MGVILDQTKKTDNLYTTTGGGVTFSSALQSLVAFDYFNDSAVANDSIYITSGNSGDYIFNGVFLTVATAMVGADIVLTWEYYSTSNTWKTLTVLSDDTNNLTTVGAGYVKWTVPTDWRSTTVNGRTGNFVRCRISSLTSISEGGANGTTVVGIVSFGITATGGTSGTPLRLIDIYNADVAGSWGVMTKISDSSFYCNQNLFIGDEDSTETHFSMIRESLVCDGYFRKDYNTTIIIGTLVDEASKTTKDGCWLYFTKKMVSERNFRSQEILGGYIYCYSSTIYFWGSDANFTRLWNSSVENGSNLIVNSGQSIYRSNMVTTGTALWPRGGTVEDVFANYPRYTFRQYNSGSDAIVYDLRDVISKNNTYACVWYQGSGTVDKDVLVRLIDCYMDNFDIYWRNAGLINCRYEYSFSCNIKILDENKNPIENVSIKISDNVKEVVNDTTNATGVIAEKILAKAKYSWGSGSIPGVTTTTNNNPFTLTISKSGYKTYKLKFDLTKKFDEIITLEKNRFREIKSR